MSLYDDDDLPMSSTAAAPGWSQGVKLLQTQLQLKKATHAATAKKEPAPAAKTKQSILTPVKDFKKTKKDGESSDSGKFSFTPTAMVGTSYLNLYSGPTDSLLMISALHQPRSWQSASPGCKNR